MVDLLFRACGAVWSGTGVTSITSAVREELFCWCREGTLHVRCESAGSPCPSSAWTCAEDVFHCYFTKAVAKHPVHFVPRRYSGGASKVAAVALRLSNKAVGSAVCVWVDQALAFTYGSS